MDADICRRQLLAAAQVALRSSAPNIEALAAMLYDRWYAPRRPGQVPAAHPQEILAHLRAADAAGTLFEPGWVAIEARAATQLLGPSPSPFDVPSQRGEELLWVHPIDFLYRGGVGLRPPPGASLHVSRRRDSADLLPGWWTSLSPAWPTARPSTVRLYWAVEPFGLYALVAALTASLDAALPYALKCPLAIERCLRPDAVVLYLPAAVWPGVVGSVRVTYQRLQDKLRPPAPALTRELAPGLALAEDPGQDSFGTARCHIVASGLWQGLQAGRTQPDALAAGAEAALQSHGVRVDAPHLNPGSTLEYPW